MAINESQFNVNRKFNINDLIQVAFLDRKYDTSHKILWKEMMNHPITHSGPN